MLSAVIVSLLASASAFRPAARSTSTRLHAEQEIKDLNLEEMFTVIAFFSSRSLCTKLIILLQVFEAADEKVSATEVPKGQLFKASFDAKAQVGSSAPLGFFDPFSQAPDNEFEWKKYRESELKHGRVAMLAFAGILVAESGLNFFGSQITGPAIFQFQQADSVLNAFTFNVLGLAAAVEGYNIVNGWQTPSETFKSIDGVAGLKDNYVNGDLKFDPLGLKPKAPEALKTIQTKELNNGRLAMVGVAGIVAQELATGNAVF